MKISNLQLAMLMMGFIFGTAAIQTVAFGAEQDAWLAYIIGWVGGFILIGLYAYLVMLNPSKTLIDILKEQFGKYLGTVVGFFYVFYFLYDSALVTRNYTDYMITSMYPETPIFFMTVIFLVVVAYLLKSGMEVIARTSELLVPIIFLAILVMNIPFFNKFHLSNVLPILHQGIKPVLKVAYEQLTFPYGQVVAFLMVFHHLHQKKDVLKVSVLSTLVVGLLMFNTVLRGLLVLGSDKTSLYLYPFLVSIKLVSSLMQPFPPILLTIGVIVKCTIYVYATVLAIAQIFGLDDYKTIVLPILVLVTVLSIWDFQDYLEYLKWGTEIWPLYVMPFQIGVPLLLVVISWLRKRKRNI